MIKETVDDLVELQGWRKPGEELQYLQGALLDNLNDSKRGNVFLDIVYLVSIPLCATGILTILSFIIQESRKMVFFDFLLFGIAFAALVAWEIFSIKGFVHSLYPTEGKFIKLVKAGDFTVCDATIKEVHYLHRTDAIDIMLANIADKQGVYCNNSIRCDWTRWLQVGSHVYLTCYEVETGKYFYKIYPSIENGENAEAGAYGMKLYHKYMVKKKSLFRTATKQILLILVIAFLSLSLVGGCLDVANYISGRYAQIDATIIYVHNYTSDGTEHANGYIAWEHNGQRFSNEEDDHYMDLRDDAKLGDKKAIWIDMETGEFQSEDGIISSFTVLLVDVLIIIFASRKLYLMITEK